MKLKFIVAASIAALGLSTAAQADEGWYVLGAVGGAYVDSDLHSDGKDVARELLDNRKESSATVKTREGAFVGKVAMGYYFNDNFALEGGYYYLGKTNTKVTTSPSGRKVKGEVSAHMLAVDAVGMLPLNDVFSLIGKLGVGVAFSETRVTSNVEEYDTGTTKKTRLVPKIGLGCEWTINQNIAIRAEYEGAFHVTKNSDETTKTDYHMATIGVKYMF